MSIETDRRGLMKATALTVAGAWGLAPLLSSEASSIDKESPAFSVELAHPSTAGQEVPLAPPDKQPPDLKLHEPVKRKVSSASVGLSKSLNGGGAAVAIRS